MNKDAKIGLFAVLILVVLVAVMWAKLAGNTREEPAIAGNSSASGDETSSNSHETLAVTNTGGGTNTGTPFENTGGNPLPVATGNTSTPVGGADAYYALFPDKKASPVGPPVNIGGDLVINTDSAVPVVAAPREHTIAKGENLTMLAHRYNTTISAIVEANKNTLSSANAMLKIGMKLKIPEPAAKKTEVVSGTPATPADGLSDTPKAGQSYKVKKNDTLSSIARAAYGKESGWQSILAANKDKVPSAQKLAAGMVIKIPEKP
ncbi:MAG TPA: LysM peptidoglycan-binding domain-containing protein [Planctomycetota bacterium]|nr:LysM peptidoglycan-binding domain-containing protein [Planctomycetota bacterium]